MTDWQTIDANSSGYTIGVDENKGGAQMVHRLLVGTAATGLVRVEWLQARFGQIIPTNWSWVQMWQYMNGHIPLRYQVDDAQNLIVQQAIENNYEWLLLYEHDVLPPPDALVRLSEYMKTEDAPVISGLYFTRSHPSEPLVYRKRGHLAYEDFDIGDRVWCDGVPTGFLLVHMSLIQAMYAESEEYMIGKQVARQVFQTPRQAWYDPESGQYNTVSGTSDLAWCDRIMADDFFTKAGWSDFARMEYPFIVDTAIACAHINPDGEQFPPGGIHAFWQYQKEQREEFRRQIAAQIQDEEPPALGVVAEDGMTTGEKVG